MKARLSFAIATIVALGFAGGVSPVRGHPQTEPQKRPGPTQQPIPPGAKPVTGQPGAPGGVGIVDDMTRSAQLDSTMQRLTHLMEKSESLSKSFGELAVLHHGADKSEILMMQRMSDAMGTMAGEIKMSFQQYKLMLEDETATETGKMKDEVQGLKGAMDVMASQIDDALRTLQVLQVQLGQG